MAGKKNTNRLIASNVHFLFIAIEGESNKKAKKKVLIGTVVVFCDWFFFSVCFESCYHVLLPCYRVTVFYD